MSLSYITLLDVLNYALKRMKGGKAMGSQTITFPCMMRHTSTLCITASADHCHSCTLMVSQFFISMSQFFFEERCHNFGTQLPTKWFGFML
jgi:hypothetical protein